MNKLEQYKTQKRKLSNLTSFKALLSKSSTDKQGITVQITKSYKGAYGNSSVSSWPDLIVEEVANSMMSKDVYLHALNLAINRAQVDMEKAKADAQEEAREVLAATEEDSDDG